MNIKEKEANQIINVNAARKKAKIKRLMLALVDECKPFGVRPITQSRIKYTLQKLDEKFYVHLQDRT